MIKNTKCNNKRKKEEVDENYSKFIVKKRYGKI